MRKVAQKARYRLALLLPPRYSRLVELFARTQSSTIRSAIANAGGSPAVSLAEVASLVHPHLEQVETRIAQQAAAFDPAIEGYVVYAVGSRGKRLRPLLALLAGGATGRIDSGHIDLAVIELAFEFLKKWRGSRKHVENVFRDQCGPARVLNQASGEFWWIGVDKRSG